MSSGGAAPVAGAGSAASASAAPAIPAASAVGKKRPADAAASASDPSTSAPSAGAADASHSSTSPPAKKARGPAAASAAAAASPGTNLAHIAAHRILQPIASDGDCMFAAVAHQLRYRRIPVPEIAQPLDEITGAVLRAFFIQWCENNVAVLQPYFPGKQELQNGLELMRNPREFANPLADHVHPILARVLNINIFVEDQVDGHDYISHRNGRDAYQPSHHASFTNRTIGIIRKPMHYDALVDQAADVEAPAVDAMEDEEESKSDAEKEGEDEEEEKEEAAPEDLIHQSELPADWQSIADAFLAKKKSKIICVFTEKGGVGKTSAVFNMITSELASKLGKILIIDADPQSNTSHCFMSPCIMRKLQVNYRNVEELFKAVPFNGATMFTPLLGSLKNQVHIILGKQLHSALEGQLRAELQSEFQANVEGFRSKVRALSADYNVTIIDMNPSFSALNEILLSLADDVLELVTGDVFSQSSMQTLMKFREDKKFHFRIGVAPSMIRRSRNTLKPKHKMNVQKVATWVKEKRLSDPSSDVSYLGFIGFADTIYGMKPLEYLKKACAREADLVLLRGDSSRVFKHLLMGTQEPLDVPDAPFPWMEELVLATAVSDKVHHYLYIFCAKEPPLSYKIGISKDVLSRKKGIKGDYKTNFTFLSAFRSTKAVVSDVEKKLKVYYLTQADVGERIQTNATEFAAVIPLLSDRKFIEDFLLEA